MRVVIRGGQGRPCEQKSMGGDGKDSSKVKGVENLNGLGGSTNSSLESMILHGLRYLAACRRKYNNMSQQGSSVEVAATKAQRHHT